MIRNRRRQIPLRPWRRLVVWAGPVLILLIGLARPVSAQEDPIHEELRKLKRGAEETLNKRDLEGLLGFAIADVVATWQDARISRGHTGVRSYYQEMLEGDESVVRDVQTEITVDELAHLYGGDTAVSTGDMVQHFQLRDGKQFDLNSRWTATLVLDNKDWRIAGFHVSASMFDNPILAIAVRRTMLWTAVLAGVLGLVVGLLVMSIWRRRSVV
jgi:ketosteroid isomerase-like protein